MTVSLECWGEGWVWRECEGINVSRAGVSKVLLVPYTQQAVRLTWIPANGRNPNIYLAKISPEEISQGENMSDTDDGSIELANTRFVLAQLTSDATIIVNDVDPDQVYRITMAPDKSRNLSNNIFFRINENQNYTSDIVKSKTGENNIIVRAEEVTLVLLILALWILAIVMFVHRWGKIRMLEPYQPDYKHIHEPSCPLNPSTSPTHVPPPNLVQKIRPPLPSFRVLPRKSSSLCFTPSMLQSGQIPPAWKVCLPQFDIQGTKGMSSSSRMDMYRLRGRLGSDAHMYHAALQTDIWHKARSAENLRHIRITSSPGKSEETICTPRKSIDYKEEQMQDLQRIASKEGKHPVLLDIVSRGMSLDSAAYNLRRSSASAPTWSTGMGVSCPFPEGRTTPEIRISPTPESPHVHSYAVSKIPKIQVPHVHSLQSRSPGIQRQETVKDEAVSSCTHLHEVEIQDGDVSKGNPEMRDALCRKPNKAPTFSSNPYRKGTLKKENVITSRGSDDTQDTAV